MKLRKKIRLLFCIFILVIFAAVLGLAGAVKNIIIEERRAAAQTVETSFSKGLVEVFESINYAIKLSYTIDLDDVDNLELFKKSAQKLIEENDKVKCVAYFKKDTLDCIYPINQFGSLVGKDMADLSYCVTLAKVVMKPVVEGPAKLFDENEDSFLFIQSIYIDASYVGEIVVAMDSDYVISSMGLDVLENENYDYELWRVDFLGQYKTVIAASDDSIDFSDAVKGEFNLPATWNISILPKGGWITSNENVLIYILCIVLGFIVSGIGVLLYYVCCLKKKLEIAKYTNPDNGFSTMEGFLLFVNRFISQNSNMNLYIIKLQLGNFRRFTKNMECDERTKYLLKFKQSVRDSFTEETIITSISEQSFLIAVYTKSQNADDLIEDFILQLHWKRRVDNKKIFITPRYCTVTYPENGTDAASLVKVVSREFEEKYEEL